MRISRKLGDEEEAINLMPLIDMVFLLLIFFLVATTIANEERELGVQLPGTSMVQPLSAPPQQLIVNILADGTLKVAGRAYERDELAKLLKRVAENESDRDVLIRADERSIHRYFAGVARLCREAGVDEFRIGYVLQKPNP